MFNLLIKKVKRVNKKSKERVNKKSKDEVYGLSRNCIYLWYPITYLHICLTDLAFW